MKRLFLFFIVILFVVISFEALFIYRQIDKYRKKDNLKSQTAQPTLIEKSPSDTEDLVILYKSNDDNNGNTVLFEKTGDSTIGNGSGVFFADNNVTISSEKGIFQGWEAIDDSLDKYITLIDPVSNTTLPKMRVSLSNPYKKDVIIGVYDLDKAGAPYTESVDILGNIDSYEYEFDSIVQEGDVVRLMPYSLNGTITDQLKDEYDVPYVGLFLVQRYGGLVQLQKEIKDL